MSITRVNKCFCTAKYFIIVFVFYFSLLLFQITGSALLVDYICKPAYAYACDDDQQSQIHRGSSFLPETLNCYKSELKSTKNTPDKGSINQSIVTTRSI